MRPQSPQCNARYGQVLGGCYLELVVNSGLTVHKFKRKVLPYGERRDVLQPPKRWPVG